MKMRNTLIAECPNCGCWATYRFMPADVVPGEPELVGLSRDQCHSCMVPMIVAHSVNRPGIMPVEEFRSLMEKEDG